MENRFNIAALIKKLKELWTKVSNINTFRGAVLAAVVSGVILAFITPVFSRFIDATHQPGSDSVTSYDIPSSDVSATPSDVLTSATIPNITTTNGTAPKGTAPKDIPVSEEMKKILAAIKKISIGSSKDWVDEKLGSPYASNTVKVTENERAWHYTDENSIVGELLECVYMFDIVSVMMYFDPSDNSCKAFFVTLMEDVLGADIVIPEAYASFISKRPLGEFTFADIWDEPYSVYGYVTNGVGRAFYGEQGSFGGSGNYQDFYFSILDYGMLNSLAKFDKFLTEIQYDIIRGRGNGVSTLSSSDMLVQQRSTLYPNTYGISVLNEDLTFSLLSSYMGFDSVSFRGPYS